jgi:hypothetical protein
MLAWTSIRRILATSAGGLVLPPFALSTHRASLDLFCIDESFASRRPAAAKDNGTMENPTSSLTGLLQRVDHLQSRSKVRNAKLTACAFESASTALVCKSGLPGQCCAGFLDATATPGQLPAQRGVHAHRTHQGQGALGSRAIFGRYTGGAAPARGHRRGNAGVPSSNGSGRRPPAAGLPRSSTPLRVGIRIASQRAHIQEAGKSMRSAPAFD